VLEGSARVADLLLRQLSLAGQNVEQLSAGLPFARAPIRDAFVDWNAIATLMDRAAEAVGGHERLADIYASTMIQALPEGFGLMRLAPDVASGIDLINRFADATFFSNIRYPMRRVGPGELHIRIEIPEDDGCRDSPAFLHMLAGQFRAATRYSGHGDTLVKADVRARQADYRLLLPEGCTPPEFEGAAAAEQCVRARFIEDVGRYLTGTRHSMEEARRHAVLATESAVYDELSAVVLAALGRHAQAAMPAAALASMAKVLSCGRLVARRRTDAPHTSVLLAEVGLKGRGVTAFEAAMPGATFVLEADVAKSSLEAAALQRLVPWLAAIFDSSRSSSGEPRSADWAAGRLATLGRRWKLTVRQQEVAYLLVQGKTNKEIASMLGCTEGTVELHAHAVMSKAGMRTRGALAAFFFRGG
jgi:DNA-binding CsgD family transcriptional regulator